jgi:hypothetical protein
MPWILTVAPITEEDVDLRELAGSGDPQPPRVLETITIVCEATQRAYKHVRDETPEYKKAVESVTFPTEASTDGE